MKKGTYIIIGGMTTLALVAATTFGVLLWRQNHTNKIPNTITKQLDFEPRILVPLPEVKLTVDSKSYKYDAETKVLSFDASVDSKKVIISEQAYPDVLIYDKLVNAFNVYSEVSTRSGKVSLGKPKDANGGQAAVMRTDTLLVFGKPEADLTDKEWKTVFDNLDLSK